MTGSSWELISTATAPSCFSTGDNPNRHLPGGTCPTHLSAKQAAGDPRRPLAHALPSTTRILPRTARAARPLLCVLPAARPLLLLLQACKQLE